MPFELWTEFGTSTNTHLFLGVGFEVCMSNITACKLKSVEFGEETNDSQTLKRSNPRIN
jgi:hypothetical protein